MSMVCKEIWRFSSHGNPFNSTVIQTSPDNSALTSAHELMLSNTESSRIQGTKGLGSSMYKANREIPAGSKINVCFADSSLSSP